MRIQQYGYHFASVSLVKREKRQTENGGRFPCDVSQLVDCDGARLDRRIIIYLMPDVKLLSK